MPSWIAAADVAAYLCLEDQGRGQTLADIATGAVRDYLGRDIEQRAYDEFHYTNNTDYILLTNYPVVSISLVEIAGWGPVTPVAINQRGWRIDPAVPRKLIFAGYGKLPRASVPNIEVKYVAGYPTDSTPDPDSTTWLAGKGIPTSIYEALLLTAAAIHTAQAGDPNLQSESTAGVFSSSFYPTGIGAIPPAARSYLQAYIGYAP
jgi:hypothetical protein